MVAEFVLKSGLSGSLQLQRVLFIYLFYFLTFWVLCYGRGQSGIWCLFSGEKKK